MSTAIEKAEIGTHGRELAERATEAIQADDLLRIALEREGGIDVVERIVALRERDMELQAERAMAEALASFQAECPNIKRTAKSHHGMYASYDEIVREIRPHLAANGLSFTHDGSHANGEITVVCTLRHVAGATRTSTFTGPIDTSGSKNPIQARASARQYGKRYTLSDVLGLATEEDDDGDAAGGPLETITETQAEALAKLAEIAGDVVSVPAMFDWLKVEAWHEIPANRHKEVEAALKRRVAKAREKAKAAG